MRTKLNERHFDFYEDTMKEAKKLASEGNFTSARLLIGRIARQLQDYQSWRYTSDKSTTKLIMAHDRALTETSDQVERMKRKQIKHLRLTDEESLKLGSVMNQKVLLDRTEQFNLRNLGEINVLPSVYEVLIDGEPTRYVIFYQDETEGRIYGRGEEFMVETFGRHNN